MRKTLILALVLPLGPTSVGHAAQIEAQKSQYCTYMDATLGHRYFPNCKGIALHPGQQKLSSFTTNKMALRDRDYSERPGKGVYRILYVGASNAVSFNSEVGLAPEIRRSLNSHLFSRKPPSGRFTKIELISAAEEGYTIVQTYLRIDELLNAYKPHLVILDDTFEFMLPKAIFDHANSEVDENGMALQMGIQDPAPSWHGHPLGRRLGFKNLTYFSSLYLGLKISLIKAAYFIYPPLVCEKEIARGCVSDIYFSYLEGIKEKAHKRSAEFLVLFHVSDFFDSYRKGLSVWYDTGWIQDKIFPKSFIGTAERDRFRKLLEKSGANSIDLSAEYSWAYGQQEKINRFDHHLTLDISNKLGFIIGKKLAENFTLKQLPVLEKNEF